MRVPHSGPLHTHASMFKTGGRLDCHARANETGEREEKSADDTATGEMKRSKVLMSGPPPLPPPSV